MFHGSGDTHPATGGKLCKRLREARRNTDLAVGTGGRMLITYTAQRGKHLSRQLATLVQQGRGQIGANTVLRVQGQCTQRARRVQQFVYDETHVLEGRTIGAHSPLRDSQISQGKIIVDIDSASNGTSGKSFIPAGNKPSTLLAFRPGRL